MCFPVRFLKCFVGFNAWVTVAVVTGLAIYFNNEFIFSTAMILFGSFGIIGVKKRNTFCLFLFNIFVLLIFLAFLLIGAGSLVMTSITGGSTQSDCQSQQWSQSIQDNVADDADSTFCKSDCGCYIDSSYTLPQKAILLMKGYNFSSSNTTYGDITQYNQCPLITLSPPQQDYYTILNFLETTYDCAGWCQQSPIYQYSNINRGPPRAQSCYYEFSQSIYRYGITLAGISLIIALIMMWTMIFSCCLCCHPDQKNQATNYYQRMAYQD